MKPDQPSVDNASTCTGIIVPVIFGELSAFFEVIPEEDNVHYFIRCEDILSINHEV